MSDYLTERRKTNTSHVKKISAEEAARLISQSSPLQSKLPFDADEASRLNVKFGDIVSVVPEDNGKSGFAVFLVNMVAERLCAAKNYPTIGKLIGLDREEFVLELSGKAVKSLRCHFPRLNFAIRVASPTSRL